MQPSEIQKSTEDIIVVQGLTKIFGETKVVDDVSLRVANGETLALIGTSGSGKTTLLKMLNGLVPRTSGEVMIKGKNLDEWSLVQLRRETGYIIQDVGLFPHYTVERNIGLIPGVLGWKRDKINKVVQEMMDRIHISSELRTRYPAELSGGQQQRVGIARALAANPDIILMDEPFGALDPITRGQMQREFLQMEGLEGKAILLVTHDMDEAALLADRICLLDEGRVQQAGPLRSLLFKPANDFVRRFFDSRRDELELKAIRAGELKEWVHVDEDFSTLSLFEASRHRAGIRRIYYQHREAVISKIMGSDD